MRNAIMPVYAPPEILFKSGKGTKLYTDDGETYLDFTSGIGVNSLGHSHPYIVNALKQQADNIWHLSNMFRIESAEILAKRLAKLTFADVAFFTNSGAEANECAIKTARRYFYDQGKPEKIRIIGMHNSFHGRTIATISAAGNPNYTKGFIPDDQGYDHVEFGNIKQLEATISEKTAAIIIEPVQGEGGIQVASKEYLQKLRDICDKDNILLIVDEVQCGVARSGHLYAYQAIGVTPDILTSAKGIGAGFPIGVCLTTKEIGSCMVVGTHGSTFGGNPLATTVANAVLDIVAKQEFLDEVRAKSNHFFKQLNILCNKYPNVYVEPTGLGLMIGLKVIPENTKILLELRNKYNLLVVKAGGNSLRFLPPLIISIAEIDELIVKLESIAISYDVKT